MCSVQKEMRFTTFLLRDAAKRIRFSGRVFFRNLKKTHFESFSAENMRDVAVKASFSVSFSTMSAITLYMMERRFKFMSFKMHEVIRLKSFRI